MKKVLLSTAALLLALSMTACTPGADNPAAATPDGSTDTATDGSSTGTSITKQQFIDLMTCWKDKLPAAAQAGAQLAIDNAQLVPDAQWNAATSQSSIDAATALGCSI